MTEQVADLELKKKQPYQVSNLNIFLFSRRALEFNKINNLLKFCLMVSCVVSFLLVFQADVHSEHYESFFVQAGVSASFVPSVFRVTMMFIKTSPSSPFIDMTVLMVMTGHLTAAGIVIFLIIVELTPGLASQQVCLIGAATFIFISVTMCMAQVLGLIVAGIKRLRPSSVWTPEESAQEVKDQITAAVL